ncbi:hypothetical protein Fmac_022595 [Flemingia macrophylla]|uniref:Uncharacterized protein n=1 Tax=Flemingia macrophylla TaxID=520843 RepID=A0ABD1M057_9FABA
MGWFYPKKKSEAWKQGYTLAEQRMDTASLSPTFHLLVILGIVLSLLWFFYYTTYKAHPNQTVIYFQLFLLSPIMFILLLLSYSTRGRLNFCLKTVPDTSHSNELRCLP